MSRRAGESAGMLLFRRAERGLEVFLAHPGGPFWKNKDAGAWTIPKGVLDEGEEPLAAARPSWCWTANACSRTRAPDVSQSGTRVGMRL